MVRQAVRPGKERTPRQVVILAPQGITTFRDGWENCSEGS
jgi:hypothetical protein